MASEESGGADRVGDSSTRFVQRLNGLQDELQFIQQQLASRDLIRLALRARRLLRDTKALLDANLTVLFSDQSGEARHDLHSSLEYADKQIAAAMGDEYEFEAILRRLQMASSLTGHVVSTMTEATENLRRRELI